MREGSFLQNNWEANVTLDRDGDRMVIMVYDEDGHTLSETVLRVEKGDPERMEKIVWKGICEYWKYEG